MNLKFKIIDKKECLIYTGAKIGLKFKTDGGAVLTIISGLGSHGNPFKTDGDHGWTKAYLEDKISSGNFKFLEYVK